MTSQPASKQEAFAAATRRFPHFALPIRRLIETDESFRDICEELADAELALAAVPNAPAALRAARLAEWQELIDRLVVELETAIGCDAAARGKRPVSPPG